MKQRLRVLIALFAGLGHSAFAATLILSDFDNTLVETRKARSGSFVTQFRIFPVSERNHVLERVPPGADFLGATSVDVTQADMEELHLFLSGESREVENRNRLVSLQNGGQIRPGEYHLRYPESYARFLAAPGSTNYLLEDLKSAVARSPEGSWKGPFWDYMIRILSNPESAPSLRIITARGHTSKEWSAFFQHVRSDLHPEIHLPQTELFHNVSRPEFDKFSLRRNVAEAKLEIVKQMLETLARHPLSHSDLRLSPDGTGMEKLHYLVIVEDSQTNLEPIADLFQAVMRSKRIPIKLGIFNMGLPTEVKDSGRKQFSIVKSDGSFRGATEDEILGEPHARTGQDCASSVLGSALQE